MRLQLRTVLVALTTLALLAFFLRHADLARVAAEMRQAHLGLLLGALVATAATYVVRALRWQYLLAPIGHARFVTAFRTTVIGFAASAVLPARAGEFLRPYLLARRENLSATAAFATIVLERLLDLCVVLLLFASFVVLFDPGLAAIDRDLFTAVKVGGLLAAFASLAALAVVFVLAGRPERLGRAAGFVERVFPQRLAGVLSRLVRTFAEGLAVMRQPRRLLYAVALSIPLWLSIAAGIWMAARAFNITLPFTGSFLVLAVLVVGVAVPTPGAVGGFHAAFQIAVTTFYATPNDRAVGAAIVLHAISFVPVSALGIVFMAQDGLNLSRLRRMAGLQAEDAGGDSGPPRANGIPFGPPAPVPGGEDRGGRA
jgi:glycosyltransferase 2 family protein